MYKTRDKEIARKSYFIQYYNKYIYKCANTVNNYNYNDVMKLNVLTYILG